MSVIWKYKIDIVDDKCFADYEEKYGISFPDELRNFIIDNNGASPDKNCILINDEECVVDFILSFNKDEEEAVTFEDVYKSMKDKIQIPFALDPFGNYYFYSLDNGKIGFYNHEEDEYYISDLSLDDFIESLYSEK